MFYNIGHKPNFKGKNLLQIVFAILPITDETRPIPFPQIALGTGVLTGGVALLAPGMMTQS